MPKRSQEDVSSEASAKHIAKRACDACRARKVRCDKESPCSACRTSNVQCKTSPRSPQPQTKRIHLTAEYEAKLNRIHARLEDLDQILKSNDVSGKGPIHRQVSSDAIRSYPAQALESTHGTPSASLFDPPVSTTPGTEIEEQSSTFEGETSMTAHSSYAHDVLQKAIRDGSLGSNGSTMTMALETLKNLTKNTTKTQNRFHPELLTQQVPDFRTVPLPPVQIVLDVLRWARETSTFLFTSIIGFTTIEEFTGLCKDIFFCIDPYPISTAVIVHGHLYNLFYEYSWTFTNEQDKLKLAEYTALSKSNFEISLAHLTTLMPDTPGNIAALLSGTFEAVQTSRPSMAWKLNSAAIAMCLSLGWHRAASYEGDSEAQKNSKLVKFWNVYVLDKSLAIRLGRAAILQDYDIDVERPSFGTESSDLYMTRVFTQWIHAGRIQGQVYERLYSPAALRAGPNPGDLLEQMQQLQEELAQIQALEVTLPPITKTSYHLHHGLKMLNRGDVVACSMITTMIHRALGNHAECLEAARRSLDLHQDVANEFLDTDVGEFYWTVYLHWTILHVPCISFIVVFCNVLAVSDLDDLARLERFIHTLSKGETEAVKRFHILCQTFWQVASLYVQARQSTDVTPNMPIFSLGMPELNTAVNSNLDLDSMMNSDLGEWFSGHQFLMGLLEDNSDLQI